MVPASVEPIRFKWPALYSIDSASIHRVLDAGVPELEGATRIDLRFEDQAVLDMDPSLEGAEQAAARRGRAEPSNSRRAG